METITAKCPKCETQYQLTPEQLAVAAGQVRCGKCLTVFQATVVEEESRIEPAAEDDQLYSDGAADTVSDDLSDSFTNIDMGNGDFFADEGHGVDSIESDHVDDDEDWAKQLVDDDDDGLEENLASIKVGDLSGDKALGSDAADFDALGIDDSLALKKSKPEALSFSDSDNPFGEDKKGILQRITPEPLEFQVAGRGGFWGKLFYSSLALCALLALAAQVLYFQFSDLSRDKNWRPVYAMACEHLGCSLPSVYSLDEISAKHLTVKSHPFYNKILVVDTIMTNHAALAQPFPQLELYFTDNNQKIIAARQFKPDEYLRGELASKRMMPSRQPVHLALEINDPGAAASGYWIKLTYPSKLDG